MKRIDTDEKKTGVVNFFVFKAPVLSVLVVKSVVDDFFWGEIFLPRIARIYTDKRKTWVVDDLWVQCPVVWLLGMIFIIRNLQG